MCVDWPRRCRAGLLALGLVCCAGCGLLPHEPRPVREIDWSGAGPRMYFEVKLEAGDYYLVWTTDHPGCQVPTLVRAGRHQGSNLIAAQVMLAPEP